DLGVLPEGDLLIHAGDLLQSGTLDELRRAALWFKSQPHRVKIFVPGNHNRCFEQFPQQARAMLEPDVITLCDTGVAVGGLNLWGSPWQPTLHDWAFMLPRGAPLRAKWDLIPDDTDILITHGPAYGFGDRVDSTTRVGCRPGALVLTAI
ncbi:MAG: metallophosphoesterase, partial [Myxococcota bacterium]